MTDVEVAKNMILLNGLDDWVSLAEAASLVRSTEPNAPSEAVKEATLRTIDKLLARDLIQVGELAPDFTPWKLDTGAALRQIDREWSAPDTELRPWDTCWLAITAAGRALAESLDAPPSTDG